jgi:monoamine oxidase
MPAAGSSPIRSLGVPFDTGGQLFGQVRTVNTLYPIAQQLGIATIDGATVTQLFYNQTSSPNDATTNAQTFVGTYLSAQSSLQTAGLLMRNGAADASLRAVCNAAGLSGLPYLEMAFEFAAGVIGGGPAEVNSTLDVFNFTQFSPLPFVYPPADTLYIPGGYGTFMTRLAQGLPIQFNTPVQSISYGSGGVTIKTAAGQNIQASTVIVTASMGVLASGSIAFNPALPVSYTSAIAALPMGATYKIAMTFKSNPFDGVTLNSLVGPAKVSPSAPKTMTNVVPLNPTGQTPAFTVNNFGNNMAVVTVEETLATQYEAMPVSQAAATALAALETPFPGVTAAWTGQAAASSWGKNPYTRGALNYATPGNAGARTALAAPINNQLWFAGDALSVNSHGQAHGAWQTGTAAAYGALGAINALTKARQS